MGRLLTPKVLRRGFELFLLGTLIAIGALLFYGNNFQAVLDAIPGMHWVWVLAGLGLASMDWVGGGVRLWALSRPIYPEARLKGLILAGGMGAWASYLTPLQSGNLPMTLYTMKRYGIPMPIAVTLALMTFVATSAFFGIAGPIAIAFGAGKSLGGHGILLGISLYDLFLVSLGIFVATFALMILVIIWPRGIHALLQALIKFLRRKTERLADRLTKLESGVDQMHDAMTKFNTPKGWLALFWATLISGPSHANKLLAGYVALRAIGIHAQFVDVLLLQTLITFLLYFFAPTPGGSGIAELLSAAVMSIYVPRPLTALYTLIWRLIISWYTVITGSVIFSAWVRRGLKGIEQDSSSLGGPAEVNPAA